MIVFRFYVAINFRFRKFSSPLKNSSCACKCQQQRANVPENFFLSIALIFIIFHACVSTCDFDERAKKFRNLWTQKGEKFQTFWNNFPTFHQFFFMRYLAQIPNAQVGATSDDVLILHSLYKYIHSNNWKFPPPVSIFLVLRKFPLALPWWAWKLRNKTINRFLFTSLVTVRWSVEKFLMSQLFAAF